jgi:hypothetical protein
MTPAPSGASSASAEQPVTENPSQETPFPGVFGRITQVTFTPDDDRNGERSWAITVEWRGDENHCVKRGSLVWNDAAADWEYEPQPSSRDDEFIARTRYSYARACALAVRLVGDEISRRTP